MPSRIVRTVVVAATITLTFVASSYAQDPAPTTVTAPPMDCQKPGDTVPSAGAEVGRFQKRLEDYKNCIGAYSRTNGAKANELAAQSRVYGDAANKAIEDYNAYVAQLNAQVKR